MKLTDTQIAKLPWKSKRFVINDSRGLSLICNPRGVKTWQLKYRRGPQGVSAVATLGHWPEMTVARARARASEARRRIKRGESLTYGTAKVTVRVFAQRYLSEVAAKRRKDLKPVRQCLDREVFPHLGSLMVAAVQPAEVQRLVFAKRDRGLPAAAGKLRGLLKRIFDYAVVCGAANSNPVAQTPLRYVYQSKPRKRHLSRTEVARMLVASNRMSFRFATMLKLLLLTLARKGELLNAQWKDIDFAAATWEVPEEKSKNGLAHVVYLSTQALELFRLLWPLDAEQPAARHTHSGTRRVDPSEYVFPRQSERARPMIASALNLAMKQVKWGMPHFTPHDLRRTASTILNEQGYDRDWIETALSHVPQGIRAVYNKAKYADQRRKMLQEWADWLEGLKDEN